MERPRPGRLHLFTRPNLLKLADATEHCSVRPHALSGTYWLKDPNFEQFGSGVTRRRAAPARSGQVHALSARPSARASGSTRLPSVLVSHILIEGAEARAGYKLDSRHDVAFLPGEIPTDLAYVAYGHIHQAQPAVANAPWVRYCGSVERLDGGEARDDKSVALVEIGPTGTGGRGAHAAASGHAHSPFRVD
jgi:hypothetical protein